MEPARRIELRLTPYQGVVLPLPLDRHELGAQGSNLDVPAFKARWVCRFPSAQWSRHPVPTRVIRRTKAEPQPCAAAELPLMDSNHDSRLQRPLSCR